MKMNIEFNSSISKLQVNFIHMRLFLFIAEKSNYGNRDISLIANNGQTFSEFNSCYSYIIRIAERIRRGKFIDSDSTEDILNRFNIIDGVNDHKKFLYCMAKYMKIYYGM